jgi:hypothetical protein
MVLIRPMSTMIKNVTLEKLATYSKKIRLVLISASHSPPKENSSGEAECLGFTSQPSQRSTLAPNPARPPPDPYTPLAPP